MKNDQDQWLLLDCLLEVQDQIAETLARPADVVAFPMI